MKPTALLTAAALGLALASPLGAHPHIYIDTDFDLVFDTDGKLAAVRIDWAYDDFYSLLMIEENGLDADGDGTPEQARLHRSEPVWWNQRIHGGCRVYVC